MKCWLSGCDEAMKIRMDGGAVRVQIEQQCRSAMLLVTDCDKATRPIWALTTYLYMQLSHGQVEWYDMEAMVMRREGVIRGKCLMSGVLQKLVK